MKKFATVLLAVVLSFSALAFTACQDGNGNNNDDMSVLTGENIVGEWGFVGLTMEISEYPFDDKLLALYGFESREELANVTDADGHSGPFYFSKDFLQKLYLDEIQLGNGVDAVSRKSLLSAYVLKQEMEVTNNAILQLMNSYWEFKADKTAVFRTDKLAEEVTWKIEDGNVIFNQENDTRTTYNGKAKELEFPYSRGLHVSYKKA